MIYPSLLPPAYLSHAHRDRFSRQDGRRRRRSVAQRAMGPDAVVGLPVLSRQHADLRQRVEGLPVQQLVPKLAVQALDVAVLPCSARLDVERVGSQLIKPRSAP